MNELQRLPVISRGRGGPPGSVGTGLPALSSHQAGLPAGESESAGKPAAYQPAVTLR